MDEEIRIELLKIFYNRHKVVNELGWKAIVDSGYDTIIEDIVEKFDLIPRVSKCDFPSLVACEICGEEKARQIAIKYVYGNHDALTDEQEVKDMTKDIVDLLKNIKVEDFKEKAIEIKDKMWGFTEYEQICNAITTVDYVEQNYLGKNYQVEFWDNVKKYLIELRDAI